MGWSSHPIPQLVPSPDWPRVLHLWASALPRCWLRLIPIPDVRSPWHPQPLSPALWLSSESGFVPVRLPGEVPLLLLQEDTTPWAQSWISPRCPRQGQKPGLGQLFSGLHAGRAAGGLSPGGSLHASLAVVCNKKYVHTGIKYTNRDIPISVEIKRKVFMTQDSSY